MPACEVIIKTERTSGTTTTAAVLTNAWVYWKEGATTTVLRTNHEGRLMRLTSGR